MAKYKRLYGHVVAINYGKDLRFQDHDVEWDAIDYVDKLYKYRFFKPVKNRSSKMKINFSNMIDKSAIIVDWPLEITKNHKRKSIRVLGVLLWWLLFIPSAILWATIVAILAIPAMIQEV